MSKIIIGKPYIESCDDGKRARLCAPIEREGKRDILYYEVERAYEKYLCDELGDAFLVGLLHTAMYQGVDIICEAPISHRLLFQLNTYYVPIISDNLDDMHAITIHAVGTSEQVECANCVGTGVSGGADSFYTIIKYSQPSMGEAKLTHLMFNNIVSADNDENRIRTLHNQDVLDKRQIAEEMGLEFVEMYSNLYMFYSFPGIFNHYFTAQYAGAVFALQKLFGVYYYSSSYRLNSFSLDYSKIPSGAPFDLFTLDCLSTKTLKFYSAGMEVTRFQKMCTLVDHPTAQKHLQVCGVKQSFQGGFDFEKLNCGSCMKCSRAIVSLDVLNALDRYEGIFDTSRYHANKEKFIGRELAGDKGVFASEVEEALKQQHKITVSVKFWRFMYHIRFSLARNTFIRKLYYSITKKKMR